MKGPVTVLHVRNSVTYGGVETTMLGWLGSLDSSRFNCPVALFMNPGGTEKVFSGPLEKERILVLPLPWGQWRNLPGAVLRLAGLIKEQRAEILHTHDWRSDIVGFLAAKITGIPIVTTIYVWFGKPAKIFLYERLDALFIRFFSRVTMVCEAVKRESVAMGVKKELSRVVHSGIDTSRDPGPVDRENIRKRFGIKDHETAFVYVARFYPEKDHVALLKAFAMARAEKKNLKLLLLGTGPLETRIKGLAVELGVKEQVACPGFVDDVPALLQGMDVMVHPSLAEGIPLAIYEGFLMGLPVVGTMVDGTPEVVIPGETGWLVPPGDVPALARALLIAAENPDLGKQYGACGKKLVCSRYSLDMAAARLEKVYGEILEESKTRHP